jgi:cysteine-rich repeat protein
VNIPDNNLTGLASTITVSGAGNHLYDVDVTTDVQHNNANDLDLFLTAPSGKRIDLITTLGGGNDDLYRGTIWDDQAGVPIADQTLPITPNPFVRTVGEGALSQFLGDDPNGDWTLTAVDHAGGTTGRLNGWSLRIVTAAICGNGATDSGELCDDGNLVDGDGCDSNCTPTACGNGVQDPTEECDDGNTVDGDECPASCHFSEVNCGDCRDDDVNGKVDALDPACAAGALTLSRATVAPAGGHSKLTLGATAALSGTPSGTGGVVLADGTGPVACAVLGAFQKRGKKYVASGTLAGASLTLSIVKSKLTVKGKGLDLPALDDPQLGVGIRVGTQLFAGGGALRPRGPRKVFP